MLQMIDGVMHYKDSDGTWHPVNSVHGAKGQKGLKGDTPSMSTGTVVQGEASAEIVDGKVNLSIPQGADGEIQESQLTDGLLAKMDRITDTAPLFETTDDDHMATFVDGGDDKPIAGMKIQLNPIPVGANLIPDNWEVGSIVVSGNVGRTFDECKNTDTTRLRTSALLYFGNLNVESITFSCDYENYQLSCDVFDSNDQLVDASIPWNSWRNKPLALTGTMVADRKIGLTLRRRDEADVSATEYITAKVKAEISFYPTYSVYSRYGITHPFGGRSALDIIRTNENLIDADALASGCSWTKNHTDYPYYHGYDVYRGTLVNYYNAYHRYSFDFFPLNRNSIKKDTRYSYSWWWRRGTLGNNDRGINMSIRQTDTSITNAGANTAPKWRFTYVNSDDGKNPHHLRGSYGSSSASYFTGIGFVEGIKSSDITPLYKNELKHHIISLPVTVYGGELVINEDGSAVLKTYPYYSSYNGETLTGRWVSSLDEYVEGTTPTIGAEVVDMSGTIDQTYELTVPIIKTLYGINNVWCDTGDITELKYVADPSLYLEKKLAERGNA